MDKMCEQKHHNPSLALRASSPQTYFTSKDIHQCSTTDCLQWAIGEGIVLYKLVIGQPREGCVELEYHEDRMRVINH